MKAIITTEGYNPRNRKWQRKQFIYLDTGDKKLYKNRTIKRILMRLTGGKTMEETIADHLHMICADRHKAQVFAAGST